MGARVPQDIDLGLKILVEPDKCTIDIVAIHGTGAHPDDTWCQLREPGLPIADEKSYINWLSDETMLPNVLESARIMRYGYESAWFGHRMISTSASEVSQGLLKELTLYRNRHRRRPLIVIAHSFGGLVAMRLIKDAADNYDTEEYADIYVSVAGMVFFGTPFRGSESLSQQTLLRLAHEHHERVDESQLRAFEVDSHNLRDLMNDFLRLLRMIPMPRVLCIYEMVQTNITVVISKEVGLETNYCLWVNRASATLDRSDKMIDSDTRQCDHLRLNKYRHSSLNEFRRLASSLERMAKEAADLTRSRRRALRMLLEGAAEGQRSLPTSRKMGSIRSSSVSTTTLDLDMRHERLAGRDWTGPVELLPPLDNLGTDSYFDTAIGGTNSPLHCHIADIAAIEGLLSSAAKSSLCASADSFLSNTAMHYNSIPFDEDRNFTMHHARLETSLSWYTIKLPRLNSSSQPSISGIDDALTPTRRDTDHESQKMFETMLYSVSISSIADTLARLFNASMKGIMLEIRTITVCQDVSQGSWFVLQQQFGSLLTSYDRCVETSNVGIVHDAAVCRAYSHFTFEVTKGELLIDGLRGFGLLLDVPVIHTRDTGRLSSRQNRHLEGIQAFFKRHVCNHFCQTLGLLSGERMITDGAWRFRDDWQWPEEIISCTNKLCRRYMGAADIRRAIEEAATPLLCDMCLSV